MRKMVLSIFVDNTFGVLSKVSGLFSRRGYNIDSLTVGVTENPSYSRMTVVVTGEEQILDQIKKQVEKLEDVKEVKELNPNESVYRELILVKVAANSETRERVISVAEIFRAKIVDVTPESMICELTGDESKLEAFLKLLCDYKILEIARTGITGLARGC